MIIATRTLLFMVILIAWVENATAQEVQRISSNKAIAFSSDLTGQLSGLIHVDSLIYATEGQKGQVHVFDAEKLTKLFSFGQTGRGPGDLSWPSHILEKNRKIYVEEGRALRLSIFDTSGNFLKNILLKKRALRFSLVNNNYLFGFDRSSEYPFYIFNLDDGSIVEFGERYNPNNISNRYELAARNQYYFKSIKSDRVLIVNETNSDFYLIHLRESPEINKIYVEIDDKFFLNRLNYVENYFKSTNLQQLSWPLLITDLQICNDSETVILAYTGQDSDNLYQGMLLFLSFRNNELLQSKSYLFEDRIFRRFAVTNDCRFIFFYDQLEGRLVKYNLEE